MQTIQEIKSLFAHFVQAWMQKDGTDLEEIVDPNVQFYTSTSFEKDGRMHGFYPLLEWIKTSPVIDPVYEICDELIRTQQETSAYWAKVSCKSKDGFLFIAHFSLIIRKGKIVLIRMDVQPFAFSVQAEKVWYFEKQEARLTADAHIPCIFPELDNPYFQIKSDESEAKTEKYQIQEMWAKYAYGLDWTMYSWVKEALSDIFENKRGYIASNKFANQRFRYHFQAWCMDDVQIDGHMAKSRMHTIIPEYKEQIVTWIKDGKWQIAKIEQVEHV